MANTKIEWTESTWNPTTGCTKLSAGCVNCYAEKMAKRLKAMGIEKYKNGFEVTLHPECIFEPFEWKKPKMVFVNSMSDLFHEAIPFEFIHKVFQVMNENSHHIFQVLTKRADILFEYSNKLKWTKNIWMGVTVESNVYKYRIDYLRDTNARIKFISFEPLLSELNDLNLERINWVIVGGESGPKARPVKEDWIIDIYKECRNNDVPFFFKQWGGINKKKNGRKLNGKVYNEMPEIEQHILV